MKRDKIFNYLEDKTRINFTHENIWEFDGDIIVTLLGQDILCDQLTMDMYDYVSLRIYKPNKNGSKPKNLKYNLNSKYNTIRTSIDTIDEIKVVEDVNEIIPKMFRNVVKKYNEKEILEVK